MPRLPLVLAAALALGACGDAAAPAPDARQGDAATSGVVGPNDTVVMDYQGRLEDGSVFDENQDVPMPMARMIPGFRDAVVGMRPGDTKTFDIPPDLAYGANPPPGIPPNATLTFDVTVHSIQ